MADTNSRSPNFRLITIDTGNLHFTDDIWNKYTSEHELDQRLSPIWRVVLSHAYFTFAVVVHDDHFEQRTDNLIELDLTHTGITELNKRFFSLHPGSILVLACLFTLTNQPPSSRAVSNSAEMIEIKVPSKNAINVFKRIEDELDDLGLHCDFNIGSHSHGRVAYVWQHITVSMVLLSDPKIDIIPDGRKGPPHL